jgi:hypothetical protein
VELVRQPTVGGVTESRDHIARAQRRWRWRVASVDVSQLNKSA